MDKMLFENFIISKTNEEAFNLAKMSAETSNNDFSPLFIFGQTGVGKTHLLNAIQNSVCKKDKMATVVNISIRTFADEIIKHINDGNMEAFERRFIDIDYLLLDGMEYLDGKEATQMELLRIVNELSTTDTKVIATACCLPAAINMTIPQLRSRFYSGIITKIDLPDSTVKIGVLEYELNKRNIFLTSNQRFNLVNEIGDNIFKLKGAMKAISKIKYPINDEILSEIIHMYK